LTRNRSRKFFPLLSAVGLLWLGSATVESATGESDEDRIRRVLAPMLEAKDQQMRRLEQRVQQLERLTQQQESLIHRLQGEKGAQPATPGAAGLAAAQPAPPPAGPADASVPAGQAAAEPSLLAKLILPGKKKDDKADAEEGPKVGGFLDVTAQTRSHSNDTFNVGIVELDLDRIMANENFGASAALNWYGYPEPVANIGAAFVDFHLYDNNIPVRGRIFQEPGFHIQAGKFDLPFSSDYQNFASRDRLTITPPMTTTRIERSGINPSNNGFNSIGGRSYGSWKNLNYSAFWVDSVYGKGTSVGGRLGGFLNNPYRLHRRSDLPIVDGGVSLLVDLDNAEQARSEVFALDLALNYGGFRLFGEAMWHWAHQNQIDAFGRHYANPTESGFHVTLSADLERWLAHKVYVYGRYQEWLPRYDYLVAEQDALPYRVGRIPLATVGFGYRLNEYVLLKVEYSDSLGRETAEPDFQKHFAIAQLVAKF